MYHLQEQREGRWNTLMYVGDVKAAHRGPLISTSRMHKICSMRCKGSGSGGARTAESNKDLGGGGLMLEGPLVSDSMPEIAGWVPSIPLEEPYRTRSHVASFRPQCSRHLPSAAMAMTPPPRITYQCGSSVYIIPIGPQLLALLPLMPL